MRPLRNGHPASLRGLLALALLAGCSGGRSVPPAAAPAEPPPRYRVALARSPLTADQQVVHVLNRLGYGPRPGDVERVRQMGLDAWIERQLEPQRIADVELGGMLDAFPVLAMSAAALYRDYPPPRPLDLQRLRAGGMTPQEIRAVFPPDRRPGVITAQLQAAKVTRAVVSERQLQEVMVDFWFNHFNVYALKGAVRWMSPAYEREAIRPHALGRFRDLVLATARHPAMLFYLDNWQSTRDDLVVPGRGRRGLNENYARELMELHTLGVDGGYTQQDVVEVARCFTGWSIDRPQEGGPFLFRPVAHDRGAKRVLGTVIAPGGGQDDGITVIDLLSRHPSTARFVSTKLVRRFVRDDPPRALVDRVATVFRDTDGDIRAMLVTIFTASEFMAADTYQAKTKTPLEVVASAVRALDGRLEAPGAPGAGRAGGALVLARQVARLGAPLYEAQPPTGYPDVAPAWVNAGALLARMNFALALAQNRLSGVRVDLAPWLGEVDRARPAAVLDRLVALVLHGEASPATRGVLQAQLDSPEIVRATADDRGPRNTDVEKLAALVLGSPEFQRR
ncbi:MAG TPA: DUF1800 domain-containing protein [Methylomirabilota bacterium]|nr:DUF1800 domain-containing protein [Methylomirabilota bacterium]